MLLAEPTKQGAGMTLFGDYWDLCSLRGTVVHISKSTALSDNLADMVLNMADDIELCYKEGRDKRVFGDNKFDKVTYYGASVLWPTLLFNIGLLKWTAEKQPVNKDQQADLCRLEACAEDALTAYDPKVGALCLKWLNTFSGFSESYSAQFVSHIALNYVSCGKPGKARFATLPEFLRMFSPDSPEHQSFATHILKIAKENKCDPEDIDYVVDWPKFKW